MHRVRTSIRRKLLFATLTPLSVAILLSWFIGAISRRTLDRRIEEFGLMEE